MFKSKWIRIPTKIILIWVIITVYFYFQHPVVYRYQGLNANIPIGNAQLLIQEIKVNNLDEEKQMAWLGDGEVPWQYQLLQKMQKMDVPVPGTWYTPIWKVISFYSWPPLAKDSWALQIDGTFIYPEDVDSDEYSLDHFDIYTYPGVSNGAGSQRDFFRNADMISANGKIDPKQMDKPLILTIVDKENGKSTNLIFTPEWQKERLFQRGDQYKSPADPVRRFMDRIYENKPQQALEDVLPNERSNFPLPEPSKNLRGKDIQMEGRLAWVDVFEGYLNVYRVDTEIGESSENNFIPQEKLTFYTVKDQGGNYKIVYWNSED